MSSSDVALLASKQLLPAYVQIVTSEQFAWSHKQDGPINRAEWGVGTGSEQALS